ncbi:hypothetical protein OUZ56_014729 [Daphnia magna]|uniref:Protein-lysine N-methyltransferase SMYD4 n=1 Tax=Daphnia magna TaxID=35525 RepID=A0ABR0AL21_9CRUS|nr:hypothetical protein OUZ56_014729 [Daphnia magna]
MVCAGATIIVEKAHASILLEEFKESHCHHCLHWTLGPVPCHQCSQVGFCTTLCRDESWASYHQYECGLLDLLYRCTRDVNTGQHGLLALRTILKAGKQKMSIEQAKSPACRSSAGMLFDSADYGTVYSLVSNTAQRSEADLFRRTIMAVYLTSFIQQGDGQEPDVGMATALLHLLQSYPCNAHEISHLAVPLPSEPCSQNQLLQLQQVRPCEVGAAIMPVVSLMNHSCNPNVVHVSYGDVMVVRVIRRILQGEEIFDNYGYHYATHDRKERQLKLGQQYFFRCYCQPCVKDWPLYGDTPKLDKRSDISDALVKDINDFKRLVCYFPEGPAKLEESVRLFTGYLDTIESDRSISLPVQEYIKVQEVLKHCFALLATLSPHLLV